MKLMPFVALLAVTGGASAYCPYPITTGNLGADQAAYERYEACMSQGQGSNALGDQMNQITNGYRNSVQQNMQNSQMLQQNYQR